MIVGIMGFIDSGKSTVATYLVTEHNFRQDSFAASLKDACSLIFGWPRELLEGTTADSREWRDTVDVWWANKLGIENFTPRLALQLIGTNSLRDHFSQDIWFLTVENRIRLAPDQHVVISDVRFPNEVKFIQDQGGILLRVSRGPEPVWYETAAMANRGNSIAKGIMEKAYASVHLSEWAWVGSVPHAELLNDSTLESLKSQVSEVVTKML